jgi:CheY-like chemotaxis protein
VVADASLLHNAILNLLINARDAMPNGGTLTIATTSVELPAQNDEAAPVGPCLLLEVLDSGVGIPSEHLPRIFDPFFTTKPVGKGTGLGLAAVAGAIKGHGGMIEVESEVDRGTAFRIYLPLVLEAPGPLPDTSGVVRGEGELLLVDDDAMVSMTAVTMLSSLGYQVTRLGDGAAALATVAADPTRFRLVLLDLRMPGMSGEATFEALRSLNPKLPILIWTGYGAEQDVSGMLKRGAVGFVQKPYRITELSNTIADAIRGNPGTGSGESVLDA